MSGSPIALRNSDVWHLVLSIVDRKTRLALVTTCHSLNQQAAPYLLGDVVLQDLGPRKLSSFLQFIVPRNDEAESAYRLRSLRGLSLEIVHPTPNIDALLALFARLQQYATNLTRLRVGVSVVAALLLAAEAPRLGAGIASLEHIRDLDLQLPHSLPYHEVLRTMRSQLVSLKLGYTQAVDPMPLLLNSRDTLEKLNTYLPWLGAGPCYPRMRDLTITCPGTPVSEHLVGTFPNLRALRILSGGVHSSDMGDAERSRLHEDSLPFLRLYHGPLHQFYLLRVNHRLNNLRFRIEGSLDVFQLRTVLAATSPSRLSLEIDQLVGGQCLTNGAFVSLFSPSLLPRLSSLALDCTWGPYEEDTTSRDDIEEALDTIVGNVPLKTFKVVLQLQDLRYNTEGDLGPDLDGWDAEDLADHLLERQPSLMSASVEIAVDPYTPNSARMWRPSATPPG